MVTGFHSPWVEPAERELAESEYGIDDPEYRFRDVLALIVKLPALKRLQAVGNGLDRRQIVWRRLRQRFAAVNDERRRTTKTLKTSIYAAFRVIGERRRIGLWRRERPPKGWKSPPGFKGLRLRFGKLPTLLPTPPAATPIFPDGP